MRKNLLLIRLGLLLLTLALAITAFAGCNQDKEPSDNGNTDTKQEDDTSDLYDADGYLKDTLPATLDYKFEEVKILGWNSEACNEFDIEALSGNQIEDAVFERDAAVEERIKVEISYDIEPGHVAAKNTYMNRVQNAINAGKPYDYIASHTQSVATCAINGLLIDLGTLENSYFDFDAPWWNQSIREKTSIGDTFFMCTGDITPSCVQMTYCLFFNADMIAARSLESPYKMVEENEWTLEALAGMTVNFYQDLDNDNTPELGDYLPLVGKYYDWPALLHGCGVGIVVRDEATGDFILDPNLGGEKGLDIMSDLATMISLDNCMVFSDSTTEAQVRQSFINETSLFLIQESSVAARFFSAVEFEYGCVPFPKYDTEQEDYICTTRQPISMYGISKGVRSDRIEMISATMEAMASEGYRSVTPEVFDSIMKYQKASSAEMSQMLSLIRDSAWFDCGRIYAANAAYVCDQPGKVLMKNNTWDNYVNTSLNTTVKANVENLSKILLDLAS